MKDFVFDLQRFERTTVISGDGGGKLRNNPNVNPFTTINITGTNWLVVNDGNSNVTINDGDGVNRIDYKNASNVVIYAGGGSDKIWNKEGGKVCQNITIDAGDGDDYVDMSKTLSYAKVSLGAGNDACAGFVEYSTIDAGAGDDQINAGSRSLVKI